MRKRNILHVSSEGASSDVVERIVDELNRRHFDVRRLINARDKYVGGELCMLIRGKDKGRDSWHYVEVSRSLMDIFMRKTRGGTVDVAKYGSLLYSGWGADPDDATAQVNAVVTAGITCRWKPLNGRLATYGCRSNSVGAGLVCSLSSR